SVGALSPMLWPTPSAWDDRAREALVVRPRAPGIGISALKGMAERRPASEALARTTRSCLGAPLARLEGQIALRRLLDRVPTLRVAVPESGLRWRNRLNLRGREPLPVPWRRPRLVGPRRA